MAGWSNTRDPLLPILLLGAAVVVSLGAGTLQLVRQRQALANAGIQQILAGAERDRLQQQLEGLLAGATELANGGNAPAKAALDALAKQGVSFSPTPPPAR